MSFSKSVFKNEERAMYELRQLYEQYGYSRYKVSKFEEYDLYARNKSFLISENILTFTDTNGKLMALKPDVTLSIVKNVRAGESQKLYYNETVYRTSASSDGFREIMQTGLECIGEIDSFAMSEVLMLAKKSLALISPDHILDVSHMGFLSGMLEEAGIPAEERYAVLREIGNKNIGAIRALCEKFDLPEASIEEICTLTSLYEPLSVALERISPMIHGEMMRQAYSQLCDVSEVMRSRGESDRLYLDFSMVNDMSYYNGIIFRGYVNGIPDGILSGGRYDSLLQKMGRDCGAIGFAVYLDLLERFEHSVNAYDADVLLVYDGTVSVIEVMQTVEEMRAQGLRVIAQPKMNASGRYKQLMRMSKGGVESLENHD